MDDSTVRLVSLELDNVLGLTAVRIKPDRTMVRIEGKNAAGKSAVLDGVCWAIGGRAGALDQPVRKGQKRARALLELGDLHVERTATASGGGGLTVTNAESRKAGLDLASPQKILDKLWGQSVDPVAFITATPKEQGATLKRLAGLDWTDLDAERDTLFKERTRANASAKAAKIKCAEPVSKPSDMTPCEIAEIAKKHEQAVEHNRGVDAAAEEVDQWTAKIADALKRLTTAESELDDAKEQHEASIAQRNRLAKSYAKMERIEAWELSTRIAEAQAHNDAIGAYEAYRLRKEEADILAAAASKLTDRIEVIDAEKAASLHCAKFPLKELGLDDMGGVTLNGIPLSQASQAEQLRAGVALSLAEGYPCRIVPVRNGSLLDEEGLRLLNDLAVEHDAQILLERVAENPTPGAVFIRDGEVVE